MVDGISVTNITYILCVIGYQMHFKFIKVVMNLPSEILWILTYNTKLFYNSLPYPPLKIIGLTRRII